MRGVEVVANTLAANGGAIRNEQGLTARLGHPGSLWSSPQDPMRPALRVRGFDAAHEGGTLEFRVTLQPASHFEVTVDYATADGTAKAGEDYTATSGTLTFEPGETEKTVGVEVLSDDDAEESETVRLRLSNIESDWPYGPLFSTVGEATGRIEDGAAPEDAPTAAPEDTGGSASGFTTGLTTVTVSVADAKVREAPGAKLEFAVTLNEAASVEVKVDYRTADGSARAGSDYTATSGTLTFRAGETEKTVSVPVLDDAHDEGNEKMLLVLDRAEGVIREDYLGIGTIENTDPMPKAWLARFGRTASDHAVAAIEGRWRSGAEARPQTHLTIGGRRVENLFDFDRVRDSFNALEAGPAAIDPRLDPESAWARMDRLKAESLGLAGGSLAGGSPAGALADSRAALAGGLTGGGLAGSGFSGSDLAGGGLSGSGLLGGGPADSRSAPRGGLSAARGALAGALGLPDLRNGLMGSSFFYSKRPGDEDGPGGGTGWLGNWSAWGNTAATRFAGADGPLSLDGEVATATLGADSRWGRWHGGLALSYSEGDGVYTHPEAAGGAVIEHADEPAPVRALRGERSHELLGRTRLRVGRVAAHARGGGDGHRDGSRHRHGGVRRPRGVLGALEPVRRVRARGGVRCAGERDGVGLGGEPDGRGRGDEPGAGDVGGLRFDADGHGRRAQTDARSGPSIRRRRCRDRRGT